MSKELSKKKDKIIKSFEEFVEIQSQDNYWKSVEKIAEISSSPAQDVYQVIKSFNVFVKNKYGEYTTRRLYHKYTPFFDQFLQAFRGKIE